MLPEIVCYTAEALQKKRMEECINDYLHSLKLNMYQC